MFQVAAGAYTGASPALMDGAAYFGTFGNDVVKLDLRQRKVMWRYEHKERHFPFYASAAVAPGRVVVAGRDKMVHCLNAQTGESVVDVHDAGKGRFVAGDCGREGVCGGGNDGRFYVLELGTGKKVWEFEAGSPLSASPGGGGRAGGDRGAGWAAVLLWVGVGEFHAKSAKAQRRA